MTWRYLAQRVTTGQWLHPALPLTDVAITRALSATGSLSGDLSAWMADEIAEDGLPLLDPWSTAIWAEDGHQIRGGGILHGLDFDGDTVRVDVAGVSAYPRGMPWRGKGVSYLEADPLDIWRACWADLHGRDLGDFYVTTDDLASPVRVGPRDYWHHEESGMSSHASRWNPEAETDAPDHAPEGWRYVEAQPVWLSPWATPDMSATMRQMIEQAGVDWLESSQWTDLDRSAVAHHIRLGAPIGARREGLRLVVGENVTAVPSGWIDGDDIADEVQVRGAGEGQQMVMGTALQSTHRLPRVAVIKDPSATDRDIATMKARRRLPDYAGAPQVSKLAVRDHPNAPLGSFDVGDWIPLIAKGGWLRFDGWVRVDRITIRPERLALLEVDVTPEIGVG
jgi:hypothetical protein